MKRRELLKTLTAIAAVPLKVSFFDIPPKHKVIAFVNEDAMSTDFVAKIKFPVEVTICPIHVPEGKTIDDVVRLYDIESH